MSPNFPDDSLNNLGSEGDGGRSSAWTKDGIEARRVGTFQELQSGWTRARAGGTGDGQEPQNEGQRNWGLVLAVL